MAITLKQPCDEGIILSGTSTVRCPKSAEPWILAATILGSSMAFIDGTVVNVALPALQKELNATVVDVQWVVESYALFLAALVLVGGSLGDRFGRKFIYVVGVILFSLASLWCGLSQNIIQLILARAVQGVGAALLVPGSLAIIGASFSKEARGRAIGTWSGFTSITATIGPVLGGWLVEHISWRAAFFINLPIGVVVLLLVFLHVPESRDENHSTQLDWRGALLATSGLGFLVYGLIESSSLGLNHFGVLLSILLGIVMLIAFVVVEKRTPDPMLPLELFRSKNFIGANLLTFFLYAALNGALFFFPLNLIQVQGYSATTAGAALLPFLFIMFFLSHWSGGLVERYGSRLPLIIGPLISAIGLTLFVIPEISENYWTSFFPAIVVLGLGMAISVAPLTTTVMNSVPQNQSGIASGVNNAVSRTAGLLAIAIFGIVMMRTFSHNLDQQLKPLDIPQSVRVVLDEQRSKLAAIKFSLNFEPKTKMQLSRAVDLSFIGAFRGIMLLASGLALASALAARWKIVTTKRKTQPPRRHGAN